jgi:O-acetylserine/cysteine efflux transporter
MFAMAAIAAPQTLLLSSFLETGQKQALLNANIFDWAAVAVLALGGFVVAHTIWYGLLWRYRVDQDTPFVLLMPIIGVLIAFLFLHERPSFIVLAGGAVILLGLGFVVGMPTTNRTEVA